MKRKHIGAAILVLVLLLTGCQTPPEAGSAPPEVPDFNSGAGTVPQAAAGDEPDAGSASDPLAPGSGWDSRPLRLADEITVVSIPRTPDTASFFLTYWDPAYEDGEVLLEQFCYTPSDRDALAEALPEVRGWTVEEDGRVLVNESLPIYGLRVGGVEGDFEAVCQGRLWLDNQGHVLSLSTGPDFSALWERFAREPEKRELYFQPALRELALCSSHWDSRFMAPADHPVSEAVPMELRVTENNGLDWSITNGLGAEITHGNGSHAAPEVLLDGGWYKVPTHSDKHYSWTLEALVTRPGGTFSGTLWQEPYGVLPDGDYRLVLDVSSDTAGKSCAAAPFAVQDGQFLIPE